MMKDYTNLTCDDFKAMSNKEFETYVQIEYANYMNSITHLEDSIEYGEYFHELEAIHNRRDKKHTFN